jgi:hypothetical protein
MHKGKIDDNKQREREERRGKRSSTHVNLSAKTNQQKKTVKN